MAEESKKYLTLRQASVELGMSLRTLQHWAQIGRIETVKLFSRTLIDRDYFTEWKARNIVKRSVG